MNDSLTRVLTSVHCFLWEAIVEEKGIRFLYQSPTFSWETTFLQPDAIHQWLPIARSDHGDFTRDFHNAVLPEDRLQVDATAKEAIKKGKARYQQDYRVRLADGRFRWVHEDVLIQPVSKGRWKLAALGVDITEKKTADAAQAQALENAHCILWYAWIEKRPTTTEWGDDLTLDQNSPLPDYDYYWDIQLLNEAAARTWLPVAPAEDEKYTTAIYQATLPEDRKKGDILSARAIREGLTSYTQHRRVQTLQEEVRWIREEVSLMMMGEDIWYAAGVMVDVTAQKQAEQILSYQATHDSLTGLFNRSHFTGDIAAQTEANGSVKPQVASLFFLDLDNFKPINDRFGHLIGDQVLSQLAKRLQKEMGEKAVISRMGGDEFTLFFPGLCEESLISRLAEKLITSINRPFQIEQYTFTLSVSIGIAQGQSDNSQDLLSKANTAMLHAKRKGKANYQFFVPEMEEVNRQRFEGEARLRRAIQMQALIPYYQPIVALSSGQIVGMEALARWPLQEGNFCPPSEFIPLAEQTGQIITLSSSLFRMICVDGQRWRRAFPDTPLRISFNVSERLFQEPGAFLQFRQLLQETRFPASSLTLELTESLLLEDSENTQLCLQALDELGIKLVLDDFGTGYSSLSYLTRLPVREIKIDQTFVRGLASPTIRVVRQNQAIIRAIIALGRALDLEITAEGIETDSQLNYLREQGVHYGQGYLFAPAMPKDAFEGYLLKQSGTENRLAA